MKQPSYIKPEEEKKASVEQDDDDFERDENDSEGFQAKESEVTDKEIAEQQVTELENDMENVEEEDEDKQKEDKEKRDKNHTIIKRNQNSVKVKVNINVTSLDKKKKKSKKVKAEPVPKEKKVSFELLDTLFSFIGVSMDDELVKNSQERLNLYTSRSHASRSTAGTIDLLPGATNISTEAKQQTVTHTPELLPVSCGYFFSIVRNLLLKQRKTTLRYLLLYTKGQAFDKLMKYIGYNSLADLLIEMMQINVVFEPPTPIKPQNGSFDEDDDNADRQSGGESDNEESKIEKKDTKLTEDQVYMKNLLEEKKIMVVNELIKTLGHKNQNDMEASLNAKAILIDLIETEKTFEIFMNNDAQMIATMVELAADPSN